MTEPAETDPITPAVATAWTIMDGLDPATKTALYELLDEGGNA